MRDVKNWNWFLILSVLCLTVFCNVPVVAANPAVVVVGGVIAIGWFWFMCLFVGTLIVADLYAQRDSLWWSIFMLLVGFGFLIYLNQGIIPWFQSLTWGQVLARVGIYFGIALVWSVVRFALYQRRGTKEYTDCYSLHMKNSVRERYRLSNNKTKFYGWFLFWPGDVWIYLFSEFFRMLWIGSAT